MCLMRQIEQTMLSHYALVHSRINKLKNVENLSDSADFKNFFFYCFLRVFGTFIITNLCLDLKTG